MTLEEARLTADAARPASFDHHFSHVGAVEIDNNATVTGHDEESDPDEPAPAHNLSPPPTQSRIAIDTNARRTERGGLFGTTDDLIRAMRPRQPEALQALDLDAAGHHHNELLDIVVDEDDEDGLASGEDIGDTISASMHHTFIDDEAGEE